MKLTGIVGVADGRPPGIPWKEAPAGPARVVHLGGSDHVALDEIILIVMLGEYVRIIGSTCWPQVVEARSTMRVQPVCWTEVKFYFE